VWQRILGLPTQTWGPARRRLWRTAARRFDGVVALTADLDAEVRRLGFDGPVRVLPNARIPARFTSVDRPAAAAALRAVAGVDDTVPLLGFVGHFVDQKQPALAVEVLAAVRRGGQPAHLVMAGDGPARPAVEARISSERVADGVTLLGHRDDPENVFAGVDLVVITSRDEGIPGVAIEAQMTGCPVVTFPVGGVAEVVDDGVTGVVLARSDIALMAAAVTDLVGDPVRRAAMGAAGAARAGRFSMAAVAPDYLAFFGGLADRRSPATRGK
jgi:glycosyltransferase involved in cell wall biosynthesis